MNFVEACLQLLEQYNQREDITSEEYNPVQDLQDLDSAIVELCQAIVNDPTIALSEHGRELLRCIANVYEVGVVENNE